MNDPKIDNRLKEIEDEIILLSGHLSDAVEKKIAVKIGDLKEGLEKFQKTVMAIPAKKGAPIAPALEYNKIQNDLDTIRKIIGSDEMDKEDDNLVRRIETFSGILMKGLVNLETNVQDSVKQSSEAQENVKASLIDNINRLNETIENVRSALTTGVGESVGGEINGIKSRVDSAAAELINNLNDVLKSVENIELQIQNSVRQTDEKQAETRTILLENLNNLNTTAVSIQRTLSIDEDKTLGTEISDIRNRIDELSEELTDNSSTLKKGIDALDTTIRDSIKQSADKLDETSELLIQNLTGLNQSTDSIRQLLTIDKKKTLGTEIAGIQSGIELISNEVSNSTGSVKKDISEINSMIHEYSEKNVAGFDEVKSKLKQDLARLNESAEIIRRMVTTDEERFLGSMTTMMFHTVQELAKDLTEMSGQINNRLVNIFKNAQDNIQQNLSKQDEIKKVLLFDLYKLNETADRINNLCATEENRPLGSEIITMSDRVEQIYGQMPNITEKVDKHSAQLDSVTAEVKRMRWFVVGAVVISLAVLIASFF